MTRSDRVTLIIEPPRLSLATAPEHEFTPVRKSQDYDAFVRALQDHLTMAVAIADQFLRETAPEGVILLHPSTSFAETLDECPPALRASLAGRIVLLDTHPARVPALLEQHRLAGAIDRRRYFRWTAHPEEEQGGGLYGLKSVAMRLQASCAAASDEQSERYCRIERSPYPDLPALVAAYLHAYHHEYNRAE